MASESNESASKNPGLRSTPPDEQTKAYFMQHTMYRIKDPEASLQFYSNVLGMSLLRRLDSQEMKVSLFLMGYEDTSFVPQNPSERTAWSYSRKATIELTHYWGTEKDPNFMGYHYGNSEHQGFGHIAISVDDTYKACKRFEDLNVPFIKKPDDGDIKGIAFIKDPDGYWIEIFDTKSMTHAARATASNAE